MFICYFSAGSYYFRKNPLLTFFFKWNLFFYIKEQIKQQIAYIFNISLEISILKTIVFIQIKMQ